MGPMWTRGHSLSTTFRGRLCIDGGFTWNDPQPPAVAKSRRSISRDMFPSAASLALVPTGQTTEWHYKCKDHTAPLWQVFRPPPADKFLEEMERGWREALRAAKRRSDAAVASSRTGCQ